MVREFKLPDVGEGVAEGEIVSWLVEPGDPVEEDQPVAEVETDKAMVEIPSPVDGVVRAIHAEAGEIVPVGTVIITFDVDGEASDLDSDVGEPVSGADEPDRGVDAKADATDTAADVSETTGRSDADPAVDADEEVTTSAGRVFAPPSVRRLAREEGVDIGALAGSGPDGRVTAADVLAATSGEEPETVDSNAVTTSDGSAAPSETGEVSASEAGEVSTSETDEVSSAGGDESATSKELPGSDGSAGTGVNPAMGAAEKEPDRERTLAVPAARRIAHEEGVDLNAVPAVEERDDEAFVTPEAVAEYAEAQRSMAAADAQAEQAGAAPSESAVTDTTAGDRETREPYRGVRRSIGEAMANSKFTAPHVTHQDVADVTNLVAVRERLKPKADERGIRLTYTHFVMKACASTLSAHPILNAQLDEDAEEIVKKEYYNVGVATDTEAGLMVPVVEDVDEKGLLELASATNELVEKARERSIDRSEMQGGTFTITNVGAIGGEFATPIINHPEVAILALGAIRERPRVHDGEVVPRQTLPLSLSIDHRVVDGADAARFTNTLIEYLEEPELLLLE